jgi:hypothetical protein
MGGSHALGHTRMATESRVTTEHSHPFSTGLDLCLVHNGSLSNHNRLRRVLQREGIRFQTDNDSEVAAGYLTWRMREGATLEQALEHCLDDLDGFYTFAVGTADGFAVLRDPIACKPAVMAETDEWVAMASEYRAIAVLPGAEDAHLGSPSRARLQLGHGAGGVMAAPDAPGTRSSPSTSPPTRARAQPAPARPAIDPRPPAAGAVLNPGGKHSIAVGLDGPYEVEIDGHVGYYCAGMNKLATVRVRGNCGVGVAENMMSGTVIVEGSASAVGGRDRPRRAAGDPRRRLGRCGISLKGADIVVRGSVGHMSAFMAQKGALVVCGDAGEALGDSLYEARLYVRGKVAGLGADCVEKEMRAEHVEQVSGCWRAPDRRRRPGRLPPLRLGAPALQLPVDNAGELLMLRG